MALRSINISDDIFEMLFISNAISQGYSPDYIDQILEEGIN